MHTPAAAFIFTLFLFWTAQFLQWLRELGGRVCLARTAVVSRRAKTECTNNEERNVEGADRGGGQGDTE